MVVSTTATILIRQLRSSLLHTNTITDLAIVMAAYLKWEKDCFSRLVGDFCLALWDQRRRVLYLVRDVAGTRALRYHVDNDRIIWSTETAALLALQHREIDEEYITGAMSRGPNSELTPYKNILNVKPAHVVTVKDTGDSIRRRSSSTALMSSIRNTRSNSSVKRYAAGCDLIVLCLQS